MKKAPKKMIEVCVGKGKRKACVTVGSPAEAQAAFNKLMRGKVSSRKPARRVAGDRYAVWAKPKGSTSDRWRKVGSARDLDGARRLSLSRDEGEETQVTLVNSPGVVH